MKDKTFGSSHAAMFSSTEVLGAAAAHDFAEATRGALAQRDEITVILATGNSQLSFVQALHAEHDIEWSRIRVLHMDEYLGMAADHPASFRLWMQRRIVEPFAPKAFYGMRGDHEPVEEELARYTQIIADLAPVICVMGIGENGHLAFNDPPADFETDDLIRIVDLDEKCRAQQVNEGHFASRMDVPTRALSLTVHALTQPDRVMVLVPEGRKAQAVQTALEGPVTPDCPASILQTKDNVRIYLDQESSSLLSAGAAT
jgi:glucosamine-6-phosphate deaminase